MLTCKVLRISNEQEITSVYPTLLAPAKTQSFEGGYIIFYNNI